MPSAWSARAGAASPPWPCRASCIRDVGAFNDALHAELARFEIDLVVLLGFLSPFETRGRYEGRAINVHPALVPAFSGRGCYGHRVHEAVIESGVKLTGATVHFVDAEYDHGPIILQEAVAVLDDDTPETLAERVQEVERRLVPEAIRLFADGRLRIEGRRVRIRGLTRLDGESRQGCARPARCAAQPLSASAVRSGLRSISSIL